MLGSEESESASFPLYDIYPEYRESDIEYIKKVIVVNTTQDYIELGCSGCNSRIGLKDFHNKNKSFFNPFACTCGMITQINFDKFPYLKIIYLLTGLSDAKFNRLKVIVDNIDIQEDSEKKIAYCKHCNIEIGAYYKTHEAAVKNKPLIINSINKRTGKIVFKDTIQQSYFRTENCQCSGSYGANKLMIPLFESLINDFREYNEQALLRKYIKTFDDDDRNIDQQIRALFAEYQGTAEQDNIYFNTRKKYFESKDAEFYIENRNMRNSLKIHFQALRSNIYKIQNETIYMANDIDNAVLKTLDADKIDGIIEELRTCDTHTYRYVCENESCNHVTWKLRHCNNYRFCPACADRYTKAQANKVFEVYEELSHHIKGFAQINIVMTIPERFWNIFSFGNLGDLCTAGYRALDLYFKCANCQYFKKNECPGPHKKYRSCDKSLIKHGGHVCLHMTGDEQPGRKQPHLDIIMPNVLFKHPESISESITKKDSELHAWNTKPIVIKPFVNVDLLRACWKQALIDKFDWPINEVDLHSQYLYWNNQNISGIYKRISYSIRQPLRDVMHGLDKDVDLSSMYWLMDYPANFHRSRWFGWLSNSVRYKYAGYLNNKRIESDKYIVKCEICMNAMHNTGEVWLIDGVINDENLRLIYLYSKKENDYG